MSELAVGAVAAKPARAEPIYAAAVFVSAALIFFLEPMVGRMLTPQLGGSPAVWNTSLAFFQAALLVGYGYAHLLQKLRSIRVQAAVHVTVLASAGLVLPLHLTTLLGAPPVNAPVAWLLGVLTLSIGAPFAVLSATAPLLQAWFARETERQPYRLYAASNLGSLLALAAYSALVEPFAGLSVQTVGWSLGYAAFVLGVAAIAFGLKAPALAAAVAKTPARTRWRERAAWIGLAAVPSSLMMGTTSYILTDVASAPFLWVAPLALYLLTFVIAFAARPAIAPDRARLWQAPLVCLMALMLPIPLGGWPTQLAAHLGAFFLTALVCHQALAARKPEPERLTDFYLTMSVGGVIGGCFNALLAPVIFPNVWEYPLALALAGLARPWSLGSKFERKEWLSLAAGLVFAGMAAVMAERSAAASLAALLAAAGCAFVLRNRGPAFALLIGAALAAGTFAAGSGVKTTETRRSFFGVSRVAEATLPGQGPMKLLYHGTTLHGAEGTGANRCTPMTYYAPQAPIGQVFARTLAGPKPVSVGAVGLGAGAVAAYTRPGDILRFFEIDPAVEAIARTRFDYVGPCARGAIDYRLGDARLTLANEPSGKFDLLLIDAFSSDSVPTHLMTVEAMRLYLDKVKPDGVVLLHLTNRNLALVQPAAAVAREAGAAAYVQQFKPAADRAPTVTRSTVMALARDPTALKAIAADPRWTPADPQGVRAWTDDYVNVAGALMAHLKGAR